MELGEILEILALLEKSDREVANLIRQNLRPGDSFTSQRYRALIRRIRELRKQVIREIKIRVTKNAKVLAAIEAEAERRAFQYAVPGLGVTSVEIAILHALVTERPFTSGAHTARTIEQWFSDLEATDLQRIYGAIQLGMIQGETIDQIVARVVGTRGAQYTDGVVAMSRRNATALVRTLVNHVSNSSREAIWNANGDIIAGLYWVATLDGRTTILCASRDGKFVPAPGQRPPEGVRLLDPPTARPPAHVNCRSIMVAALDPTGVADRLGTRPFVGFDEVGQVPGKIDYGTWLTGQPQAFQDMILGKTRARLFRDGGLTLDRFVDRQGATITLAELAMDAPEAFTKAGI